MELGELDGHVLGGRYRLGDKLGQGGMGAVYAAMQTSLGRKVAVKVLLPMLSSDPNLVARFRTEAQQAGKLNHPNIVQILEFGQEDNGSVWIAMEILEGEALADRIERGPMSEADVVRFAKETLAGLEAAHNQRLVHRDLKPDNIFISSAEGIGEVVKILDFGIAKLLDGDAAAKLTATGLVIGTPLYMSPEQARGDELDQRSDLYSLGAVMYEALTGQPPFTGRNYNALLVAVLTDTPKPLQLVRPDITPELADVVMRALDKDAVRRFGSASEMSAALSTFAPKTDKPPTLAELGLASTMATPQIGSVEPAKPVNDTPIAGGVGPATRASDMVAAAAATTEPMTNVPERTLPVKRRHGWLVPSMVAVALLAGVGGTMAFMQTASDSEAAVAVASVPAGSEALLETGGSPAAEVTPIEPATPVQPVAAIGPGDIAGLQPTADPTTTDEPSDTPAKAAPMRRLQLVNIRVSGGMHGGHSEFRQHVGGHANWTSCWPRGRPLPDMNRGIDFSAQTTADGTLSNVRLTGNNNYPDVATCMIGLLQGASMGPSRDGEGHTVRIGFTFYPVQTGMRRRR